MENEALRAEVHELRFAAGRMLAEGRVLLERGDTTAAERNLQLILNDHPTSPEADSARRLLLLVSGTDDSIRAVAEAAESVRTAEESRRLSRATASMRKEHDDFKGRTFYEDRATPTDKGCYAVYLYFSVEDSAARPSGLRLRVQYFGEQFLFTHGYTFWLDGKVLDYTPSGVTYDAVLTFTNGLREHSDDPVDDTVLAIVQAVIQSKSSKIRFLGRDSKSQDRAISNEQKRAMQRVLDAYRALEGE